MLDIKNNNLFIGNVSPAYGIIKVLNFYDLAGINWIFLHRINSSNASLIKNHKISYTPSKLGDILANGNNLFRVDIIVIESDIDIVDRVRKHVNIPIIVIGSNITKFNVRNYDFVYNFKTRRPSISGPSSIRDMQYTVSEVIRGVFSEQVDLDNLFLTKVRDMKLNTLLG